MVKIDRRSSVTRSSHPSRYALPGVVVPAQLDYAIRGLVSLALTTDDRTKIEVLASDHGLSRKFLAQVLVALRNAGIIDTHRGSDGGYRLARRPEQIRLIDVFDIVSPGVDYQPRSTNGSHAALVTQDAWGRIAGAVRAALAELTLADLIGEEDVAGRDDRTAGAALDAPGDSDALPPGGREEVASPSWG
jgi:Rrf2 family iron-sulfur cluster assembly transcriptional regulator